VEKELKEINHNWGEIEKIAKNREDWKFLASPCPTCLLVQQELGR
jgi:predicted secreted protein